MIACSILNDSFSNIRICILQFFAQKASSEPWLWHRVRVSLLIPEGSGSNLSLLKYCQPFNGKVNVKIKEKIDREWSIKNFGSWNYTQIEREKDCRETTFGEKCFLDFAFLQ